MEECDFMFDTQKLAATGSSIQGNFLDNGRLHPAVASDDGLDQLFGDSWQWTASTYTGYPGYKPLPGALGEYRQVYVRPDDCAWRLLRHAGESFSNRAGFALTHSFSVAKRKNVLTRSSFFIAVRGPSPTICGTRATRSGRAA